MGYIDKFVRNEAGRAIDQIQNFSDSLKNGLSKVNGYLGTLFEVAKNGETFVGLQYSAEESIRGEIRTYVSNVRSVVAEMNEKASLGNAFKGETSTAISEYVETVSKMVEAYVSHLLRYSDRMHEYVMDYKKNDTTLASNIGETSKSLSSGVEEYVEKY